MRTIIYEDIQIFYSMYSLNKKKLLMGKVQLNFAAEKIKTPKPIGYETLDDAVVSIARKCTEELG